MRAVPAHITDLWEAGGPFIGDEGAPHTRVTVEEDWALHLQQNAGNFRKGPVRWFQRKANNQVETEIPNIKSVRIERTLDAPAQRAVITLNNQWHYDNGSLATNLDELGQPGYFTFNRGDTTESQSRWNQEENDWSGVIVPNAMIRVYMGYGGKSKTIADAVDDGNIVLVGIFLVDIVSTGTGGLITLQCRDMAKLLIDQFLFPPLVPDRYYPLTYCRYYFDRGTNPEILYGKYAPVPFQTASSMTYSSSTGDEDGNNTAIQGHLPTSALDSTTKSYWLSSGQTAANKYVYYEIEVSEPITHIFGTAQWGGYQVYISVMEGGTWQGSNTIPTTGGLAIPYIHKEGVEFNGGFGLATSRVYQAQRVRITFTKLRRTEFGEDVTYRGAIQELRVGHANSSLPTKKIVGLAQAPNNDGYWLLGSDGGVFAIGQDAAFYGSSGGGSTSNQWTGISALPDGTGYYTVRQDGRVFSFGSAVHYGHLAGTTLNGPIVAIQVTSTGEGYWLLGGDGGVFAFGDATYYGNGISYATDFSKLAIAFEARPQDDGYWILHADGHVSAPGSATNFGDAPGGGQVTGITATATGNGYWIVKEDGSVYSFGSANYFGGANTQTLNDVAVDIARGTGSAQSGYTIVAADGGVFNFNTQFWGSLPDDYSWEVRQDGNYKDYTDIIKELLLWSGWWLRDPAAAASAPPVVFGNIETTGIFNNTGDGCLPEEMFDKRPVIDAINEIKEIVGYNFWIDENGGARFELPNWFTAGNNIQETGVRTAFAPVIDEEVNLIDLQVDYTDSPVRSEIIISTADPQADLSDTITARLDVEEMAPESAALLRGMVKPMMWINGTFQNQNELETMAEMVATQIIFNQRTATMTIAFNPQIQINDQVQVYERQTSETYLHYVRGLSIEHDLESGKMSEQLTTHWLGPNNNLITQVWSLPASEAIRAAVSATKVPNGGRDV